MFERLARHERYALCILAIAIPAAIGCYATAALSGPAETGTKGTAHIFGTTVIEAFDRAGNVFIAGSGNGCEMAAIGAIYPADMVASRCIFRRAN